MFDSYFKLLMYIIKFLSLVAISWINCLGANETEIYFNLFLFKLLITINIAEGVIYDMIYYTKPIHKCLPIVQSDIIPLTATLFDYFRMVLGIILCVMFWFVDFNDTVQYYPLLLIYHFWQGWFEGFQLTDYPSSVSHNILSIIILFITTKKYKLLIWSLSRSMPLSVIILRFMIYNATNYKIQAYQY
jgi:hypothetical protein